MYTISENGRLNIWECDTELDGLKPYEAPEGSVQQVEISSDEDDSGEHEWEPKNKGIGFIFLKKLT